MDSVGHYARPELLSLNINKEPTSVSQNILSTFDKTAKDLSNVNNPQQNTHTVANEMPEDIHHDNVSIG